MTTLGSAYNQFWSHISTKTSQVFRVKAAESAMILLSATAERTDKYAYEVGIGVNGNVNTWIRKDEIIPIKIETRDILSANEFRTFWLRWEASDIELGRGSHVGVDSVIHWQDPNPTAVHALSLASGGSATAQWELYQLGGK